MTDINIDIKEENKNTDDSKSKLNKSKNFWILPVILSCTVLVIAIVFFLGGDGSSPDAQNQFTEQWRSHRDEFLSADTKAKKSDLRSKGIAHLNEAITVDSWFGKVEEVGSDYVTVESQGIKYYLYPKGKNVNYLDFDKNMGLYFSGILNGKYFWDDLESPGIYVDCFSILGDNKTKSYFEISASEKEKYLKAQKATEEFNDKLKEVGDEFKKALKEGLDEIENNY